MRLKVPDELLVFLVNLCMNLNPYFRENCFEFLKIRLKVAIKFLDKIWGTVAEESFLANKYALLRQVKRLYHLCLKCNYFELQVARFLGLVINVANTKENYLFRKWGEVENFAHAYTHTYTYTHTHTHTRINKHTHTQLHAYTRKSLIRKGFSRDKHSFHFFYSSRCKFVIQF